jgi:hypothetical protein
MTGSGTFCETMKNYGFQLPGMNIDSLQRYTEALDLEIQEQEKDLVELRSRIGNVEGRENDEKPGGVARGAYV